jgi:ribosomal protein S18 acetylase RimI-like enzyme
MITYRNLAESDLLKIAEIDRSEVIRVGYEVHQGAWVKKDVMWDAPNFIQVGEGEHTVSKEIEFCRSHMARNAIAIGGFNGETLTAIGILTPNIRPAMAQLAYLHVSRAYRRKGIGAAITHQLLAHASALGSKKVYVSAVPSESAVGFYKSFGFDLIAEPLPELYELEPDDIHMVLELDAPVGDGSA